MIKRVALVLSLLLLPHVVLAQNKPIFQSGVSTPGHLLKWITNGVAGDAGGALGGTATELGLTNTGTPFCISDAPISSPTGYHQLCLGANVFGTEGLLSYNAYNGAPQLPLVCMINGASYSCINNGTGNVVGGPPTTVGDLACWNNTAGTLLSDCGPASAKGITQLTGPVTAGPGSGSQATTITPTGVTAGTYTCPTETINAAGQITSAISGSCGGLGIPNSPLISGNGSILGSVAVGSNLSLSGTFPNQTLSATGTGGGGITQITNDVLAGPGTGSVVGTVAGLQGRPLSGTAPTSGQCLGWNGSTWLPVACGTGGGAVSSVSGSGQITASPTTGAVVVGSTGTTANITLANACAGNGCTPVVSCLTFSNGVSTSFTPGACNVISNRMLIQTGSAFLIQTGSNLLIQ